MNTFTSNHGFHPTSITSLHIPIQFQQCTPHLLYSLPPSTFVDRHELLNHHSSYSFHLWGTSDLELPVFAVDQSNTTLLLSVVNQMVTETKVPLHLRYGSPTPDPSSYVHIKPPEPVGFFSCPHTTTTVKPNTTPPQLPEKVVQFITQNGTRPITFFPAMHASNAQETTIRVPIGRLDDLPVVEYGTVFTIFFLFWYLVRVSHIVSTRLESRHEKKVE